MSRGEGSLKHLHGLALFKTLVRAFNKIWRTNLFLVDVSDIFYFSCSGEGKGESEAPEGWVGEIFY